MLRKGRSQREIERLTGVDRKTIRRYERGRAEKAAGKLIETFLGAHFSGAPRDRCRFLLSHELSASEYRLHELCPGVPDDTRAMQQGIDGGAAKPVAGAKGELREKGSTRRLQARMRRREIRFRYDARSRDNVKGYRAW